MSMTLSNVLKFTAGQMLPALGGVLAKGGSHAAHLKVEDSVMLAARLYPDMLPLNVQVFIATDIISRGAARLAGIDMPSFPNTEATFAELGERAKRVNDYIQGVSSEALDAAADRDITYPLGPEITRTQPGREYLLGFVLPNFYFHVTTTYDLLRHQGVVLGKRDFIAPPEAG